MDFTCLVFGLLFCTAGIVFAFGKGHIHLQAWKQMPPDEKAKIRILPLCRNIGGMIALCGVIFVSAGVWEQFQTSAFVWTMIAWMALAAADVYYIGKSSRYRL